MRLPWKFDKVFRHHADISFSAVSNRLLWPASIDHVVLMVRRDRLTRDGLWTQKEGWTWPLWIYSYFSIKSTDDGGIDFSILSRGAVQSSRLRVDWHSWNVIGGHRWLSTCTLINFDNFIAFYILDRLNPIHHYSIDTSKRDVNVRHANLSERKHLFDFTVCFLFLQILLFDPNLTRWRKKPEKLISNPMLRRPRWIRSLQAIFFSCSWSWSCRLSPVLLRNPKGSID